MYWWRLYLKNGEKSIFIDGIMKYNTMRQAEIEYQDIDYSIGIESYARLNGIDLTEWTLDGTYIVTSLTA